MKRWIFSLEVELNVENERTISNRIKGLVILQRGEFIHVILFTKLRCFARYCFSCSVDTAIC